jgi:hypothetical protein
MIDANLSVWLIEWNTNPCLELSAPLLTQIIPKMIENVFRIAIDPYYSPNNSNNFGCSNKYMNQNLDFWA